MIAQQDEQLLASPVGYLPAATIDEVVAQLEDVIAACVANNSRCGYFAVLYHRVTCRVREGILNHEFEDGKRMARLDVLFANRYLQAWHSFSGGQRPTASWQTAFDTAADADTIIMQHLLLGINAHINLDLGIAAAETMQGYALADIKKDFDVINTILASLVNEVEDRVAKAAPLLFLLNLHKTNVDEMLVQFSINTARQGAWDFAVELGGKTGDSYTSCIATRDEAINKLAGSISKPCRWLKFTVKIIHWFENKNVRRVIEILQGK